jgi:hypothetical protein
MARIVLFKHLAAAAAPADFAAIPCLDRAPVDTVSAKGTANSADEHRLCDLL